MVELWRNSGSVQEIITGSVTSTTQSGSAMSRSGSVAQFNHSREIEFNFSTLWTTSMKLGTLVHHDPGYKICLRFFNFCPGT